MNDGEIDKILKRTGEAPHAVDPALLERIAGSIGPSVPPVRPLPPAWVIAGGLSLIVAAIGVAGAAKLGLHGITKLSGVDRAVIFPALGVLTWLAASACAREMVPASRRRVSASALLALGIAALLAVFGALFRDYATERFVAQGMICLAAGLAHAAIAAIAGWLILRRGYALNPLAAGVVAGTLAAMAGVTMLELHCPNLETLHVMVWHTAVVPISAAAGALLMARRALRGDGRA